MVASLPFAPEIVLPATDYFINHVKLTESNPYGFKATFNPTYPVKSSNPHGWVSPWHYGLNQGPIILMIENYRTGNVWKRFMGNADIQRGLAVAGFTTITSVDDAQPLLPRSVSLEQNYPNPFNPSTVIEYSLAQTGNVRLEVFNETGEEVGLLVNAVEPSGHYQVTFNASKMGYYTNSTARSMTQSGTFLVLLGDAPNSAPSVWPRRSNGSSGGWKT